MKSRRLRAQSTAEYAVILAVVIGAAIAMQVYVKRGLQARQKAGVDAVTGITGTFTTVEPGGTPASFKAISQYEPYYAESAVSRTEKNIEREHMGSGKVVKEKVADVTTSKVGTYQRQTGPSATSRDAMWTP